uniref:Uncharacterized protein n=1 Tax=Anguilla anguilla TaxID=7936 RepID=A0A0E9TDL6_ANGAN
MLSSESVDTMHQFLSHHSLQTGLTQERLRNTLHVQLD